MQDWQHDSVHAHVSGLGMVFQAFAYEVYDLAHLYIGRDANASGKRHQDFEAGRLAPLFNLLVWKGICYAVVQALPVYPSRQVGERRCGVALANLMHLIASRYSIG